MIENITKMLEDRLEKIQDQEIHIGHQSYYYQPPHSWSSMVHVSPMDWR